MKIQNPNQASVGEFMSRIPAQAKSLKDRPAIPDLEVRILRARLLLEELCELIEGFGLNMATDRKLYAGDPIHYEDIRFQESKAFPPNIIEIADALGDIEVVLHGASCAVGLDMQPVYEEIMLNNMMKLTSGTIDAHGKLIKPKNHPRPDILTILLEQQNGEEKASLHRHQGSSETSGI